METPGTLQQFFMFMGPWKWVMILLSVLVLVLIVIKIYEYFIEKDSKKSNPNDVLFWGCLTLATGMLAQINGIWNALNEIMDAPDISPVMVLIGFLSSFNTTLYGLVVCIFAALSWWGLKKSYDLSS